MDTVSEEFEFNQEPMPEKRKRGRPKKNVNKNINLELKEPRKLHLAKKPSEINPVELDAMQKMEPRKLETALITICCDQLGNIISMTTNVPDDDIVRIKGALRATRIVASVFEDKMMARIS